MTIRNGLLLSAFLLLATACGGDTAGTAMPNGGTTDTGNNSTVVDMGADACDSNADCTAPDVCVFDLFTGEGTCGEAAGTGETGDACTMASDCASNLCINGLCADPCEGESDCPAGYTCQPADVDLNDGGTATINVCLPEAEPCGSNNDCTDPDVCVVDRSGDDAVLECDDPVGDGDLGEDCSADADCPSNLCLDGTCTEPCETANDCATDGSYVCEFETVSTGGGSDDITICKPRDEDTCLSDADCSGGDRCIANKTATDIEFTCGDPNANGGESGDSCTGDADCAQNLCVDGTCSGPCEDIGDCGGSPLRCEVTMVDLGNNATDSAQICLPPVPCDEADDCRTAQGEVCYIEETNDAVDLFCRDENVGGGDLGQVCNTDRECANNYCSTTRFRDVCTVPCADDGDCGTAGYECGTITIDLQAGGTETIGACVPEPLDACTDNDDCGTGFDCAIIANEAGNALESVCIPATGGDATGVACNDDDDCASLVCFNDFCAAPCTDDTQCGQGQLCQNNTVSKDNNSGSFDVCETLPDTQCTSSDDCPDGVRVCGDLRDNQGTQEAFCTFPNTQADQLGTDCTANNECREDVCLIGIADECSVVCDKDTDCDASQECTTYGDLNFCNTACGDNTDCGAPDRYCTINGDELTDEVDQVCVTPIGANDLGAICSTGGDCLTGLCLRTLSFTGTGCTSDANCSSANGETCECPIDQPNCTTGKECATTERRCTNLCDGNSDCSGGITNNPMTECSPSTFVERPSGSSAQISTCARP